MVIGSLIGLHCYHGKIYSLFCTTLGVFELHNGRNPWFRSLKIGKKLVLYSSMYGISFCHQNLLLLILFLFGCFQATFFIVSYFTYTLGTTSVPNTACQPCLITGGEPSGTSHHRSVQGVPGTAWSVDLVTTLPDSHFWCPQLSGQVCSAMISYRP